MSTLPILRATSYTAYSRRWRSPEGFSSTGSPRHTKTIIINAARKAVSTKTLNTFVKSK